MAVRPDAVTAEPAESAADGIGAIRVSRDPGPVPRSHMRIAAVESAAALPALVADLHTAGVQSHRFTVGTISVHPE